MQSETEDFAPGAATRRIVVDAIFNVVFDSGLLNPLYENMTSSTKPEVHNVVYRTAIRAGPSHGHR